MRWNDMNAASTQYRCPTDSLGASCGWLTQAAIRSAAWVRAPSGSVR